jgi:hypothetical protein
VVKKKVRAGKKSNVRLIESEVEKFLNSEKPEKVNVMLRVDAQLLEEGKGLLGRRLSSLFESALKDAIKRKKENE